MLAIHIVCRWDRAWWEIVLRVLVPGEWQGEHVVGQVDVDLREAVRAVEDLAGVVLLVDAEEEEEDVEEEEEDVEEEEEDVVVVVVVEFS